MMLYMHMHGEVSFSQSSSSPAAQNGASGFQDMLKMQLDGVITAMEAYMSGVTSSLSDALSSVF